jgi:hypothetical protein
MFRACGGRMMLARSFAVPALAASAFLIFVACGGSVDPGKAGAGEPPGGTSGTPGSAKAPPDSTSPPGPADPVCRSGAPAASALGTCDARHAYDACRIDATSCCFCAGGPQPSGPDAPFAWTCPSLPRNAASCPAEPPADGAGCLEEGVSCTYCGRAPGSGLDSRYCSNNAWLRPQGGG